MAETVKVKKTKKEFFSAVGRRKRAVARVWLYTKKGDVIINGKPVDDLYPQLFEKLIWVKPFHLIGVSHPRSKFSATVKVVGGGKSAQLEAIQLGITRAIIKMDAEFKSVLKKAGLTTRDPREVERKKTSQPKARKKPQYSKR